MILRALYLFVYTFAFFAGLAATLFSRKIRRGFWARVGLAKRIPEMSPDAKPLWFHFASSGEFEQCLPILDEVKLRSPATKIFLSYFSPTAERALQLETERRKVQGTSVPWDYSDFSPFEFPWSVRSFLNRLNPSSLVLIHREIWPSLLHECNARKIPCYLFATYFPPHSKLVFGFLKSWLRSFHMVGANEHGTARFFQEIVPGTTHVKVMGDPRVERVLQRKSVQRASSWAECFKDQKVLVLASMWEQDLREVAEGIERLGKMVPSWRVVVVPHEPDAKHVARMLSWLSERGQPARKWSDFLAQPDFHSPLVVDTVGFLAELYSIASLVFVGGSFKGRVHNVLEPAAYGRPILTGPFIENSAEAVQMWEADEALVRVKDSATFSEALDGLATSQDLRDEKAGQLNRYIESRKGASARYAEILV